MVENSTQIQAFTEGPPRVSEWRRFWRVFLQRRIVIFGLVVLGLLVFSAAFANIIAPHNPYVGVMADSLQQPNKTYWLGTDIQGRDTLSRIIFGARTVLEVGFITVTIGAVSGFALGMLAGYFGGAVSAVILRVMDAMMSFPMLIMAMLLAAVLGGGLQNVIIALTIASIPGNARVMNGLVLTTKQNDYVLAERAMGTSNLRIMLSHILPNALPPMIVLITLQLGGIIMAEAGLSYLGIGIKPPGAAWGAMVNTGYPYLLDHPILSFAPGIAIMLVVFAFNMIGDGLRDALDPRLRGLL
ncbi:MAG: ABC transporter permease [Dehalococcoidales bacterium]|jgi:ABC-type dipeptide/oligopeptide/nickel transport system permease subunit